MSSEHGQGEVGQPDVSRKSSEMHLSDELWLPTMLDMPWLESEKHKVVLYGDDLLQIKSSLLIEDISLPEFLPIFARAGLRPFLR